MRGAVQLRLCAHCAQVKASDAADVGNDRGETLLEPVPDATQQDAEEDDSRRHQEDDAPQRHKAWMVLGQLLSVDKSLFMAGPTAVM